MSILFSEFDKSDNIYQDFTPSNDTYSRQYSATSNPFSKNSDFPSKRSMLRQLNRTFKQQMSEVDACFRGVNTKYGNKALQATCDSHLMNDYQQNGSEVTPYGNSVSQHPQQIISSQENADFQENPHSEVIISQQRLRQELASIASILGKRTNFVPSHIQKISEQYQPIKWNLLMHQSDRPLRQLYKTTLERCYDDKGGQSKILSQNSITYTQESSLNHYDAIEQSKEREYQYQQKCKWLKGVKENKETKQGSSFSNANYEGKLLKGIEARIINSSCTMTKTRHSKQINKSTDLFNRLANQKNQRENLLKNITFNFK